MKAIFVFLMVVAIGWVALYFLGGYSSFDPSEQGRKAKAALRPGMTWQQAFQIAGEPKKYRIINRKVERTGSEEIVLFVPSREVDFDRDRIADHFAAGTLPHGFMCRFDFSNSVAFALTFDGTGTLTKIEDATTMADLLETK